jgi:hypothetical protein
MDQSKLRRETLDPQEPFSFSQASLQDYTDCARRFQLRYLKHLSWPAAQAEPVQENERHIRRGERFHRLAQQALLGIPLERLAEIAAADPDPELASWWDSFTGLLPSLQTGERHVELQLSAPLGRHRLLAQFDLVQVFTDEKRVVIWDWKTSLARPKRAWLEGRLQTIIYPYLLARAGAWLNGGQPFSAEQIEMVYWFTGFPHDPERLTSTPASFKRAEKTLTALVKEIEGLKAEEYEKTPDEKACRFCVYRSLCERGTAAGTLTESADADQPPAEIEIDFDQIGEISF